MAGLPRRRAWRAEGRCIWCETGREPTLEWGVWGHSLRWRFVKCLQHYHRPKRKKVAKPKPVKVAVEIKRGDVL